MSIKMIVIDLDGTLLKTDKSVSEYTQTILNQCRKLGIKVVYATGRGGSARQVAPSEFFDGEITMNGAVARVSNDVVYSRLIPCQTARPILIACDKRGIKITSEISDMHYSNFVVSDEWPQITDFKVVDFLRHDKDAEKIYLPNTTHEDRKFIEQLLSDDLYFVVTDGFFGQIMHKDATKSKALSELARRWGINQAEIVAFGNDYNDIEMLRDCGIGVAVANAINEAKAIADYICDVNDRDGVAKWLEENVL